MSALRAAGLRWGAPLLALVAWELVTRAAASPFFTPPADIVARMYELWFSGPPARLFLTPEATGNILPSLGRMAVGLALATVAGVALGVALGRSPRTYAYLDPMLQFARAIPPPTLVPVFVVLFSLGTQMQVASITFSVIWPILLNSADGARSVDPIKLETAAAFRFSTFSRVVHVVLPSAMPKIFAGLRLSLSLGLILMVFSELLPGTSDGIGFQLVDATSRSDLPTMWAAIMLLGILGYLLNTALLQVERHTLHT